MSDPVTDFVETTITIDSVGPSQQGFGVLNILTHSAPWNDRTRYYSATADASTDGFGSGHPVYRCLSRILAQDPKPDQVAVTLLGPAVLMEYTVGVQSIVDSTAYTVNLIGEVMADASPSFTSGVGTTNDLIAAGLLAAINAVTGREFTAELTGSGGSQVLQVVADAALTVNSTNFTADSTTDEALSTAHGLLTGDGPITVSNVGGSLPGGLAAATPYWIVKVDADHFKYATSRANARANTTIDITSNGTGTQSYVGATARRLAPNKWFSLEVASRALLNNTQAQAAPSGLAADLDAAVLTDDGWFGVTSPYGGSAAYQLALDSWLAANDRITLADSCDSGTETHALSGATDCPTQVAATGTKNSQPCYHSSPAAFLGAASLGSWLATDPGTDVMHLKLLQGITAVPLSGTGRNNIKAKFCSSFYKAKGLNVFVDNGVPSRVYRYMDVVRNLFWMNDQIETGVFGDMAGAKIIPYTQAGIQRVEGRVRGVLEGTIVPAAVLADGTDAPVVTAPNIDDVPEQDKEDRVLRNVKFSGILQGAVYSVKITGSVVF